MDFWQSFGVNGKHQSICFNGVFSQQCFNTQGKRWVLQFPQTEGEVDLLILAPQILTAPKIDLIKNLFQQC